MIVLSTTAQIYLPTYGPLPSIDNSNRRFQLQPYASVSAGVIFFNAPTSYLSAPMGLMLAKPLSNNWAAFSSLSLAPTVFSINRLYTDPASRSPYPANPFSGTYGLGLNAAVQAGLIYTNDAKTFSISGSVILERGTYPVYTPSNKHTYKPAY
jgi:hypothetical protein